MQTYNHSTITDCLFSNSDNTCFLFNSLDFFFFFLTQSDTYLVVFFVPHLVLFNLPLLLPSYSSLSCWFPLSLGSQLSKLFNAQKLSAISLVGWWCQPWHKQLIWENMYLQLLNWIYCNTQRISVSSILPGVTACLSFYIGSRIYIVLKSSLL